MLPEIYQDSIDKVIDHIENLSNSEILLEITTQLVNLFYDKLFFIQYYDEQNKSPNKGDKIDINKKIDEQFERLQTYNLPQEDYILLTTVYSSIVSSSVIPENLKLGKDEVTDLLKNLKNPECLLLKMQVKNDEKEKPEEKESEASMCLIS